MTTMPAFAWEFEMDAIRQPATTMQTLVYGCGCANIPDDACDCDGNVLDALACAEAIVL